MTRAIDIAPEHLAQVQTILARHLPNDVEVLVFGSRARGGAKRFSDLDLALKDVGPLDPTVMAHLVDAFEESSLPWRVDLVDYHALTPAFLSAVEVDLTPLR
ncbi:nucleotidyltransferase domain-containing protein (plasmid) [Gemmobacter fulvus]|uniref:Nucleotidyltransferase domain-containing protein n=1 Tax=Gemmobacter fulvus TaxID=2840474 RepID=A0A975S4P0_9RHOB|nr:nucleotidyltransferase domain-containing protein [Gemmobacter fulvus]MBT9247919.1 nucleotidyltransferase domain-containing protein [Gemmobacter fulvus]QWK93263.1 nucleotidyltransferase domain-containing protein [Gemmobacter fulvus]